MVFYHGQQRVPMVKWPYTSILIVLKGISRGLNGFIPVVPNTPIVP